MKDVYEYSWDLWFWIFNDVESVNTLCVLRQVSKMFFALSSERSEQLYRDFFQSFGVTEGFLMFLQHVLKIPLNVRMSTEFSESVQYLKALAYMNTSETVFVKCARDRSPDLLKKGFGFTCIRGDSRRDYDDIFMLPANNFSSLNTVKNGLRRRVYRADVSKEINLNELMSRMFGYGSVAVFIGSSFFVTALIVSSVIFPVTAVMAACIPLAVIYGIVAVVVGGIALGCMIREWVWWLDSDDMLCLSLTAGHQYPSSYSSLWKQIDQLQEQDVFTEQTHLVSPIV